MKKGQFTMILAAAVLAGFLGGATAVYLGGPSPAVAADNPKELKVSRLCIVDRNGKERITLEVDEKAGFAGLGIGDRREKGRIALVLTEKGEAMMGVMDEKQNMRAALMTDAYGRPYVVVMDEKEQPVWRVPQ